MCCSDCNCQRSNTCTLNKFFCFLRICIGVSFCFKIIFLAADFTKLCFTWNIQCICYICYAFCLCNVCLEVQFGSVDHNRSISCMDCLHSQFKTAAVIKMKAYRDRCFFSFCCNDCCIGIHSTVLYSRWSCLDHNRCFQFFCSLNDGFHHFHILCIKCSDCISTFLSF